MDVKPAGGELGRLGHFPSAKSPVTSDSITVSNGLSKFGAGDAKVDTLLHCVPPVCAQPPCAEMIPALVMLMPPLPVKLMAFDAVLFDASPQFGAVTVGLPWKLIGPD